MTNEQKRTRNWQKARLIGFNLNPSVMTIEEQLVYSEIMNFKRQLLNGWDIETERLIGHSLPPHRCSWCGKRGNVPHIYQESNYCYKHYLNHITNGAER